VRTCVLLGVHRQDARNRGGVPSVQDQHLSQVGGATAKLLSVALLKVNLS